MKAISALFSGFCFLSVAMVDFSKIPQTWDDISALRRRAQKGRSMMVSTTQGISQVLGNIKNVSENHEILRPLVLEMSKNGVVETPPVEKLSQLVVEFYSLAGYPDPGNIEALAHQDAWGIKRCLSLVRRKWSRAETPKDFKSAIEDEGFWRLLV